MKRNCRVGITTNLARRRKEWENEMGGPIPNWTEFGPFASREDAQAKENELSDQYGCIAHGGGAYPDEPSPWYVYLFFF